MLTGACAGQSTRTAERVPRALHLNQHGLWRRRLAPQQEVRHAACSDRSGGKATSIAGECLCGHLVADGAEAPAHRASRRSPRRREQTPRPGGGRSRSGRSSAAQHAAQRRFDDHNCERFTQIEKPSGGGSEAAAALTWSSARDRWVHDTPATMHPLRRAHVAAMRAGAAPPATSRSRRSIFSRLQRIN